LKHSSLKKILRFAAVSIAVGAWASAHADETTLCQPHEEIYFSCPTGKKIISLCASGNISPDNGYVQYRFGTPDHVELQFPNKPYPPKSRFLIGDILGGNVNYVHIKFKSGKYNYVVYQGLPSGLYIKKNGRLVSNLVCDQGIYQQLSRRAYRGMRTAQPVEGVDN